jgi:Di-N-acetylchitobiase
MLTFAVLLCAVALAVARSACPCSSAQLCAPVAIPLHSRKELFMFADNDLDDFASFNYTRLTTLAVFNRVLHAPPPVLLCEAHSKGVRVVYLVNIDEGELLNATATALWTQRVVADCVSSFCDGLNIDFESPVPANSAASRALSRLVKTTCDAMHQANPFSSCTFDVAWRAGDVDGRAYDYAAIAKATDFVFVMIYDTRSQLNLTECVAGANTPIDKVHSGIQSYLRIGVDPTKLIVGLPWYGYVYPCLPGHNAHNASACAIKPVPFRGAPCSDASGREFWLRDILTMIASGQNTTAVQLERATQSLHVNWRNSSTGELFQIWFDSADTLAQKCRTARLSRAAGGVGVWTVDMLPYGTNSGVVQAMWAAFDEFF